MRKWSQSSERGWNFRGGEGSRNEEAVMEEIIHQKVWCKVQDEVKMAILRLNMACLWKKNIGYRTCGVQWSSEKELVNCILYYFIHFAIVLLCFRLCGSPLYNRNGDHLLGQTCSGNVCAGQRLIFSPPPRWNLKCKLHFEHFRGFMQWITLNHVPGASVE